MWRKSCEIFFQIWLNAYTGTKNCIRSHITGLADDCFLVIKEVKWDNVTVIQSKFTLSFQRHLCWMISNPLIPYKMFIFIIIFFQIHWDIWNLLYITLSSYPNDIVCNQINAVRISHVNTFPYIQSRIQSFVLVKAFRFYNFRVSYFIALSP